MNRALGIIGFIAFILGLVIAVVAGIFAPQNSVVILVLVLLGVIIGLLNITSKELIPLLLATIALIVVGGVFAPITTLGIGKYLDQVLSLVATLVAPAAVIAAVKALWAVGFPKD
ncbi:MAG: hypothetical protein FJZ83_05790 [Chloroflexi bacterium]|nr:hypothetical protein [Chloroflexota bacterium]MBM3183529.1 hypothetical protein [Chloroflexota bacterium]MBM4451544.1 hypothetical protein [Chloroflexota bacterium]MBM4454196.1 hypothetical protein [Chloroflexota bacterium]